MAKETIASLAKRQLQMASEWSAMKNQWDSMNKRVIRTERNVERILGHLENDDSTNSTGMVEQVRKNTMFRQDFKTKTTLLGMIGGVLTGVAFWLLKLIFN